MNKRILSFALTGLIIILGNGIIVASELDITGELTSKLDINMDSDAQIRTIENRLRIELANYSFTSGLIKASFEVSDDDDLFELREAFTQLYLDSADLTIGRQRIAWGRTDRINPTDYFNPIDYRRIFEEDNRSEVAAVRVEYYYDDWIIDSVWVPANVEEELLNSEFGVRLSRWSPSIDASISYYKGVGPKVLNHPLGDVDEYDLHAIGGDFSKELGEYLFRGEMGYFIVDEDFKDNYIEYVLGVDFDLTDDLYLNLQLAGEKQRGESGRDRIVFAIEYEINSFKYVEVQSIYNIRDNDYYLSPQLNYDLMDGVDISLGARIFSGDEGTEFGFYSDQDHLFVQVNKAF
ncbi:hypothetical protein [Halonatronum saccharophilum]|uniref:hypothetical protein n=1 Tax=Halonatronum saccharophilum TaxID=150060 RepID=UPI00048A27DB|nr:hypothetical protein [Halonatronum saccharophilum]